MRNSQVTDYTYPNMQINARYFKLNKRVTSKYAILTILDARWRTTEVLFEVYMKLHGKERYFLKIYRYGKKIKAK